MEPFFAIPQQCEVVCPKEPSPTRNQRSPDHRPPAFRKWPPGGPRSRNDRNLSCLSPTQSGEFDKFQWSVRGPQAIFCQPGPFRPFWGRQNGHPAGEKAPETGRFLRWPDEAGRIHRFTSRLVPSAKTTSQYWGLRNGLLGLGATSGGSAAVGQCLASGVGTRIVSPPAKVHSWRSCRGTVSVGACVTPSTRVWGARPFTESIFLL